MLSLASHRILSLASWTAFVIPAAWNPDLMIKRPFLTLDTRRPLLYFSRAMALVLIALS